MPVKPSKSLAVRQRRQQVADLYLQGWTQTEIAGHLGKSQPTICDDLKRIRIEWRDSMVRDFDAAREMELKRIDKIAREAWSAWERSQKPQQSAVVSGEGTSGQATRKSLKNRHGDVRCLEILLRCSAARRVMLGIDAPTMFAPVIPDGRPLDQERLIAVIPKDTMAKAFCILEELGFIQRTELGAGLFGDVKPAPIEANGNESEHEIARGEEAAGRGPTNGLALLPAPSSG